MFRNHTIPAIIALTFAAAPVSAASIDLMAMDLEKGDTIATASGGVFFDDGFPLLTSDDPFDPLLLDGFSGAIQFAFEGDPSFDTVLIDFDDPDGFSVNQREYEVIASGDDGSDILELLLEQFSPFAGGKALLTISFASAEVQFTSQDPFAFFSVRSNDLTSPQDAYSVSVNLAEVNNIAPIPLPAGLLLLSTALVGFGFVRKRKG